MEINQSDLKPAASVRANPCGCPMLRLLFELFHADVGQPQGFARTEAAGFKISNDAVQVHRLQARQLRFCRRRD